jgi:hypothetical protein
MFALPGKEAALTKRRKSRRADRLKKGVGCQSSALQYTASNIHSGKVAVVSSGSRT